jgi:A/G-specific adenine glycosylase
LKTIENNRENARKSLFRRNLMRWHQSANLRVLPWKETLSPYHIWLSEIILQQTRAAQGIPYYEAFVATYPTLEDLSAAPDQEVMKLWQGLGYYARCRNMLATARLIVSEQSGKFPETYEGLLKLKGIGPYTAAAISSFAFGLPKAVVDGNVYRVLARYFALDIATDSTEGKKQFQALADELLDPNDPGEYNQAIMDFGSTVCAPGQPDCKACPLSAGCQGFEQGIVHLLPRKKKKTAVRTRYFNYLVVHWNGRIWLRERKKKDIWQGLYEPYLVETASVAEPDEFYGHKFVSGFNLSQPPGDEGSLTQRLSHQLIEARFFSVHSDKKPIMPEDGVWVPLKDLKEFPLPVTPATFFEKKGYF